MKSVLLATVATIALCANAVAADQNQSGMTNPGTNRPAMSNAAQSQSQQPARLEAAQRIDPEGLNQRQISLIQRELNDQGFNAGSEDGKWGPKTRQAMQTFQKQRNLATDHGLNRQTLSELGVNIATTGTGSSVGTTGSGSGSMGEPSSPPASDRK